MFSIKRVNAIFQKDFKDFSRNIAVSISLFLPLVLAAIYGRMGVDSIEPHYLVINMALAIVATFVQCCLIAEEKEKNTLRGLMLSPASTTEILIGKSLLSFILTMGVIIFSLFLSEYRPQNIAIIAIAIVLASFFSIGLGTLLGLFAKSVMDASVIILPVMILFSLGSWVNDLAGQYPFLKVVHYFPNSQLVQIATKVESGAGFGDVLGNLGIILVWGIVTIALTIVVYRKRMVD